MPQLVKGGKYIFGWSLIKDNGGIVIPREALKEYELTSGTDVILISGSKTSGGFIVCKRALLEKSSIGCFIKENPDLTNSGQGHDNPFVYMARHYLFTKIGNPDTLTLNTPTLNAYGIKTGDYLLSGRGSYLGIAMIVKGRIAEQARKHPELEYIQ